ncbi:hypothetical protein [Baekduia sp. Peel2402]|uniref:hypothetical protein n=1 Tax=Baekduia sp. Peel2402 TaxID=3458296 RepID=UPI00403E48D8
MKPSVLASLAVAAAAAAAVPATAGAASWSAPVDVIPAGSAPNALVSPATGKSLVLAGSGSDALLATGTAAGVFGSPVPIASGASALGLTSALGADGTVAIGWAAGGTGHVTVLAPNGSVRADAALPGTGVNSIDVGVTSDGAIVVAYRTKESANSYSLQVATMPAGTTAFGEPVALQSGAAVDSIDVATGGGGAVAIAYRQLGGKYRARVAVRPAGASAFEAGVAMSRSASEGDDYSPRVAFDADGTLVAVWGNAGGALYALRPAGAGAAFGEAQPLGSGPAYDVDLVPAPGGGAAVSYAGSGSVWAALQGAPGASFSAPVQAGPAYSSPITVDTAVTAAPNGTVTALWADPTTGAVHAVDAGGADTTVGYGSRDGVTPVSIASTGDRTLAAWKTAAGTVVAATRSATTRAAKPGELGPAPAGLDTTRPKLTLVGFSKRLKVSSKTKSVVLKAKCSEACKLFVTSNLRTQPQGSKSRQRVAPLPPFQTKTPRTGTQKITLKLGNYALKDLRAALKRKHGGQLFVVVEASDAAGNTARQKLQITLKPTRR